MNRLLRFAWMAVTVLALVLGHWVPDAAAAPNQQEQNLLQNPGFEGAYGAWNGIPQIQMPAAWTPWWIEGTKDQPDWENQRPEWKPAELEKYPNRVHSGTRALQWHKSYATFYSGAYQQVTVPANAPLRFSAYGQAWSCSDYDKCHDGGAVWSYEPANMGMMIGIDPTGGTNPMSGSIVWSAAGNPLDGWGYFQVDATAQGSAVTVFLLSHPDWPKQNQDAYYDDAALVAIGAAPATAPAQPAPASSESAAEPAQPAAPAAPVVVFSTATPQPDGTIVHTVEAGDTVWSIAARYGVTVDELNALNDLGAFIYEDQQIVIRQGQGTPAEPTAEPTPEPTVAEMGDASAAGGEPTATQEPVAETVAEAGAATGASLCVMAFNDQNANASRDAGEGLLSGIMVAVMQDQQTLGTYTTDGVSEPYCFTGLPDGNYRVLQQIADQWTATTSTAWAVSLRAGDLLTIEFGSVASQFADSAMVSGQGQAAAQSQAAVLVEEDAWTRIRPAVCTGGGIFGALLVIGAALFMILSRRKS